MCIDTPDSPELIKYFDLSVINLIVTLINIQFNGCLSRI